MQWQKTFSGVETGGTISIQQTTDGGYIIAGNQWGDAGVTGNHGLYDCGIIKLDANANLQWQKVFGGSSNDGVYSIQQTTDGGYIFAGYSNSNDGDVTGNHGYEDDWIVKLSATGNLQWQKALGGSNYDRAHSIQQTTDGGYIIAGSTKSNDGDVTGIHSTSVVDYWIVKLSTTGELQWQKTLGGSSNDEAASIQQTTDGGYIVVGYSNSNDGDVHGNHGFRDFGITKLDVNGNVHWGKCYGGSNIDYASSIEQTMEGGYVIAGYTGSGADDVTRNHGGTDYWIIK